MARENLIIAHRTSLEKYTYFLLAAAGAAIGLAINQTRSSGLSMSQIPPGLAVFFWLLSFLCGCLHTERYQRALWLNELLLDVNQGTNAITGLDPAFMAVASQDTRERFNKASIAMKRFGSWQFRFLILGALVYLIWHVWQMYLRTGGHG